MILALDLYFRHNPSHISKTHPEVLKLSQVLNTLPIHEDKPNAEVFRNPNGVYMKLCNYLRFDPGYEGVGLTAGGKLEKEIWSEFSERKIELAEVANRIRRRAREESKPGSGLES